MTKVAFNNKKTVFTSTLDLNLRKKLVKCYIWSILPRNCLLKQVIEGKIKGEMEVTRR